MDIIAEKKIKKNWLIALFSLIILGLFKDTIVRYIYNDINFNFLIPAYLFVLLLSILYYYFIYKKNGVKLLIFDIGTTFVTLPTLLILIFSYFARFEFFNRLPDFINRIFQVQYFDSKLFISLQILYSLLLIYYLFCSIKLLKLNLEKSKLSKLKEYSIEEALTIRTKWLNSLIFLIGSVFASFVLFHFFFKNYINLTLSLTYIYPLLSIFFVYYFAYKKEGTKLLIFDMFISILRLFFNFVIFLYGLIIIMNPESLLRIGIDEQSARYAIKIFSDSIYSNLLVFIALIVYLIYSFKLYKLNKSNKKMIKY